MFLLLVVSFRFGGVDSLVYKSHSLVSLIPPKCLAAGECPCRACILPTSGKCTSGTKHQKWLPLTAPHRPIPPPRSSPQPQEFWRFSSSSARFTCSSTSRAAGPASYRRSSKTPRRSTTTPSLAASSTSNSTPTARSTRSFTRSRTKPARSASPSSKHLPSSSCSCSSCRSSRSRDARTTSGVLRRRFS
ncbi:hypothetical protein B0H17DRAFT_1263312 [Mycena rosella]|uniref:Secreted protein n=2 Tax=Mycena rosella TaxID=1033263 RepID=A0AAD7CPT4_MYCRO|nr:hypothetical protein B0H17DRAFT_1263312 [Mycena rosella]